MHNVMRCLAVAASCSIVIPLLTIAFAYLLHPQFSVTIGLPIFIGVLLFETLDLWFSLPVRGWKFFRYRFTFEDVTEQKR
jgi:hypothetical protein